MKGGAICAEWKQIRNGEERCFHAYRTGEKQYTTFGPDGVMSGVFSAGK